MALSLKVLFMSLSDNWYYVWTPPVPHLISSESTFNLAMDAGVSSAQVYKHLASAAQCIFYFLLLGYQIWDSSGNKLVQLVNQWMVQSQNHHFFCEASVRQLNQLEDQLDTFAYANVQVWN